jgi:hypothetical protein
VHRPAAAPARTITLDISANSGSPLVNPAFVIENWSDAARITVTGKGVKVSCPAHTGYVHHLEGDSLIVFLEYSSTQETQVQIEPVAEQGR